MLRVISKALEEKIDNINAGRLPQKEELREVKFCPQGGSCPKNVCSGVVKVKDRWS